MIRRTLVVAPLVLALASCGSEPAAGEPEEARVATVADRPPAAKETAFAAAFAEAIAEDVRKHGPHEPLARVVIRWFEATDPLYFTVHVLSARTAEEVDPEWAWYPLEWPDAEVESRRTERLAEHPEVRQAGRPLAVTYENDPAMGEDVEWWGDQLSPSPAIVETVRRLPGALRAAGVRLDRRFAASAAHFEGYGNLPVLEATADPGTLAALEARGELPEE